MYVDTGLIIFIFLMGLIFLSPIVIIILNYKKLLNWRSWIITITLIATIGSMIPPIVEKGPLLVTLIFGLAGGGLGFFVAYLFLKMFPDVFKKQR